MNPSGVPTKWTTLAQQESRGAVEALTSLPSLARVLGESGGVATRLLHNVSTPLAKASALVGPASVQGQWDLFLPSAVEAVRILDGDDPDHYQAIVDTILFVNLADTHGVDSSSVPKGQLLDLLDRLPEFVDEEDENESFGLAAAFAALASRRTDLVQKFTGRALPAKIDAEERFEIDFAGFLAYMAAAIEKGTTWETVEKTWLNHVAYFPIMRAASEAQWPQLYAAARASLGYVAKVKTGSVADAFHKLIMQMIGAGL